MIKKILVVLIVIVVLMIFIALFSAKTNAPILKNETSKNEFQNPTELVNEIPIRNLTISPYQEISTPLSLSGEARGTWFFEASFPVEIQDDAGNILGIGVATANGDWMTENFVAFSATIPFQKRTLSSGKIILRNDNPSGDPTRNRSVTIPIRFK